MTSKDASPPLEVAIVEDEAGVRAGLMEILQHATGIHCAAACGSAEEALQILPELAPDVVLMDVNLPEMNGIECVRNLVAHIPDVLVIMLTIYDAVDPIFDSIAAGAMGYLLKPVRQDELLAAIRDVTVGGSPMTSAVARKVLQTFRRNPPRAEPDDKLHELTLREREVLDHLARGFIEKEVASELGVSFNTVHTMVSRIYRKLQVRTRRDAIAYYVGGKRIT